MHCFQEQLIICNLYMLSEGSTAFGTLFASNLIGYKHFLSVSNVCNNYINLIDSLNHLHISWQHTTQSSIKIDFTRK